MSDGHHDSDSEGDSDGYDSDGFSGGVGGPHVTDVTNASRTCLMDLGSLEWSQRCIDAFGVPSDCLPRIASSAEEYGVIHRGPLDGVPLTGTSVRVPQHWRCVLTYGTIAA